MCESQDNKKPYVSLIKINGKPILPPVITSDLRKELLQYKQQAIKLEKRLKTCRELKQNLEELQNSYARPCSELTFGDNSHIDALDISDKPNSTRKLKDIHLSKDLIEVTQYNFSGSKTIFCNQKLDNQNALTNTESPSNKAPSDNATNNDIIRPRSSSESREDDIKQKICASPKPRLIRSNSYTLEAPSPILLEHLKRSACGGSNHHSGNQWVSSESCHNSEIFSTKSTVVFNEADSPDQSSKDIKEVKSPTINSQLILDNMHLSGAEKIEKNDDFSVEAAFKFPSIDSHQYLANVLKEIPDFYAKQIIEMLKHQTLEEKEIIQEHKSNGGDFGNDKELIVIQEDEIMRNEKKREVTLCPPHPATNHPEDCENLIDFSSLSDVSLTSEFTTSIKPVSRPNTLESTKESPNNKTNEKLTRSSTFSMSPSQSIYYSGSDSDTVRGLTPALNLTVEYQEEPEVGILQEKEEYWEAIVSHELKTVTCSRELFPELDPVTMQSLKRDWAASVIGAHIRGYLTRRLIKTEKVQTLIATVKDVLMCALELHHSDNIDEKDVELHRRLINQLSAALYSFHEIFFELPIAEQMSLIRADRQRKIEKLKRPQSGRKSASKSINSSRSDKSVSSISSARSSSKISVIKESPKVAKV
ncbi:uncharacterized protein LOC126743410 [Anthonomus grandis grandis]|uniref:uncharacterized protein LOC126743410 n=1 Tax=Anthonomus grandis grandis TaxID=2921223 RepID=UPI00216637B1|nr:uncharacterized protein LOC126743410 [Anthonomus grandis grandis]XP_050306466.1 uncharacterized protein LOC126743410 [Anthonomus grandis grandis]